MLCLHVFIVVSLVADMWNCTWNQLVSRAGSVSLCICSVSRSAADPAMMFRCIVELRVWCIVWRCEFVVMTIGV
jgi:hypothetical protein